MPSRFTAPCTDHLVLPGWLRGFDPIYQEADRGEATYERNLPHWRYAGATYFLTFRLHDSLPASALQELREAASKWEARLTAERNARGGLLSEATHEACEAFQKEQFIKMEQWLDQGHGACELRDPAVRRIVGEALGYFEETRCRMAAWVIMPNHVHAVCHPLADIDLEDLVGSWKKHSARKINLLLGRSGQFWQRETYDRIIRDGAHFRRIVRYIARNPQKAFLREEEASVWLTPAILGA
jgi:putative transposase